MNIEYAINLRNEGKLHESNAILLELVKQFPDDAIINYQCAWSFDVLELETDAIYYYEKAISLGLSDYDLKEAYLGLGSTYRCIGKYSDAKHVFQKAIQQFEDNSLKVFYAMVLYNLNEHSEAMKILLKVISETSEDNTIKSFSKAINFYSDKLDKIFT